MGNLRSALKKPPSLRSSGARRDGVGVLDACAAVGPRGGRAGEVCAARWARRGWQRLSREGRRVAGRAAATHYGVSSGPMMKISQIYGSLSSLSPALKPSTGFLLRSAGGRDGRHIRCVRYGPARRAARARALGRELAGS